MGDDPASHSLDKVMNVLLRASYKCHTHTQGLTRGLRNIVNIKSNVIIKNSFKIKESVALGRLRRSCLDNTRLLCTSRPDPAQGGGSDHEEKRMNTVLYGMTAAVATLAAAYLAVPLYKIFCTATGETLKKQEESQEKLKGLAPPEDRESRIFTISFDAGTNERLEWSFRPCQRQIKVIPGKSSLAFYNAKNKTDRSIVGIATYNVTPVAAGLYFNKIQCFCFEEQRLKAGEDIDMPVFFYLDPELYNDKLLNGVSHITLSYTFFEATDSAGIEASIAAGNELLVKDPKYYPKVAQSPYTGDVADTK